MTEEVVKSVRRAKRVGDLQVRVYSGDPGEYYRCVIRDVYHRGEYLLGGTGVRWEGPSTSGFLRNEGEG